MTPTPRAMQEPVWQRYQRQGVIEAREATHADWPYKYDKRVISISPADWEDGLRAGGMVARNPDNHADQWYIAPDYFAKHYSPSPSQGEVKRYVYAAADVGLQDSAGDEYGHVNFVLASDHDAIVSRLTGELQAARGEGHVFGRDDQPSVMVYTAKILKDMSHHDYEFGSYQMVMLSEHQRALDKHLAATIADRDAALADAQSLRAELTNARRNAYIRGFQRGYDKKAELRGGISTYEQVRIWAEAHAISYCDQFDDAALSSSAAKDAEKEGS